MLVAVEERRAVEVLHGDEALVAPSFGDRPLRELLALPREAVAVGAADLLERRDQVAPRCPAARSGGARSAPGCCRRARRRRSPSARATSTRRRRRPRDRAISEPTAIAAKLTPWRPEPQKRFSDTPVTDVAASPRSRTACRRDARALLARLLDAADHDVLDVGEVESGADGGRSAPAPSSSCGWRPERRPAPFLPATTRRADGVDDVSAAHGGLVSPRGRVGATGRRAAFARRLDGCRSHAYRSRINSCWSMPSGNPLVVYVVLPVVAVPVLLAIAYRRLRSGQRISRRARRDGQSSRRGSRSSCGRSHGHPGDRDVR